MKAFRDQFRMGLGGKLFCPECKPPWIFAFRRVPRERRWGVLCAVCGEIPRDTYVVCLQERELTVVNLPDWVEYLDGFCVPDGEEDYVPDDAPKRDEDGYFQDRELEEFLLYHGDRNYAVESFKTVRVFLSLSDAEAFANQWTHRFPRGWRTHGVVLEHG